MRIILVDDELLALKALMDSVTAALPGSQPICFTSAIESISFARENQIDIAFLDIEMRSMNGLQLATALKKLQPNLNIIFVTGHLSYAVDAFAVRASDYLLKPTSPEAILGAMQNLRNPIEPVKDEGIFIQTFGYFDVFVDGRAIKFQSSRAREVLAILVDHRGAGIKTTDIAGILWEDRPYNRYLLNQTQKAISSLMATLRDSHIERIVLKRWNSMAVDKTQFSCDYYDLLKWDPAAVNNYFGEYMKNYSWAEITAGSLSQRLLDM